MKTRHYLLGYIALLAIVLLVGPFSSEEKDARALHMIEEMEEGSMKIEAWMYHDIYFTNTVDECKMPIEDWMTDESSWVTAEKKE
ncbi:hypothetical protein EMN47_00700 [Prolixibacteraceae bacterium JC049]|jgi:hypothetical protein|nr:hypothetical protein [Prolixibacteraceae bacterium JC049]